MKDTSLFNTILENVTDGVLFVDREGRVSLWNTAAEALTGYAAAEMQAGALSPNAPAHRDVPGEAPLCGEHGPVHAALQDGQPRTGKAEIQGKAGEWHRVTLRVLPVYSGGTLAGAVELFAPLPTATATAHTEAPAGDLADPLTGLPGHAYLQTHLTYTLQTEPEEGGTCLVLANLDNFGAFNASFGRETGDIALQSAAANLAPALREEGVIGRLGEDEFLGIFHYEDEEEYMALAEEMRAAIADSGVEFEDDFVGLTASVGQTALAEDDTGEAALQRVRALVQQSKKRGKNCSTIQLPPGAKA